MKEKPKSNMKLKPKSKSNSLKRSLNILKGGEEQLKKEEETSSFFSFLSKREDSKIPEDPNATNGPETDEAITFKSGKLLSILSPSEAVSAGTENPSSTGWFLFRVFMVILIVLIFILNLTGYLDNVVAFIKNFYDTNIAPLLVSIGLIKTTPVVADRSGGSLPGNDSKTGTNTINQLDKNVGTKPVTTTPPSTTSPTPSTTTATPSTTSPTPSTTTATTTATTPTPTQKLTPMARPQRDPTLQPIPIQPHERRTPLVNKGDSARPPASAPAPYQEETSREKQRQESVRNALEYALRNQNPVADDATSRLRIPRTKSGYCYIGEDRGFRSCIEVTKDMKCMSGDIFPTRAVCVNPRLRV